jgi:sugar lactone lactonase YvrE
MSAATRRIEPFVEGLHFGEGPRWHQGRLWYSDFFDEAVFSVDEAGHRRKEVDVPGRPSGLGWLPDGRLLVVSMLNQAVMRREPDGALVQHASLLPWAESRANDMVVSPEGRAYVGNFGYDPSSGSEGETDKEPWRATLVRVDPDGTATPAAENLAFPNGTVITADGRTLIIAETLAEHLSAFDIGPDGALSSRRVWGTFPGRYADGICLDAEGAIWAANALAPECVRVGKGGEVLEVIETDRPCFACMLGGADRRTLYIVTAATFDEEKAQAERTGRIVQVTVDAPGTGWP